MRTIEAAKAITAAALAASILAAPAAAAPIAPEFRVDYANRLAIASNNDFRGELQTLGLTHLTTSGVITLTAPGRVTFEYLGSESGFTDTFTAGDVTYTEYDSNRFGAPVLMGIDLFPAGLLEAMFTTSGNAMTAMPGDEAFGVFLPRGERNTPYTRNVLYFGFDDQINNVDDNHDDFIVRATVEAIPEPGALAMFAAGMGLIGLGRLRARR